MIDTITATTPGIYETVKHLRPWKIIDGKAHFHGKSIFLRVHFVGPFFAKWSINNSICDISCLHVFDHHVFGIQSLIAQTGLVKRYCPIVESEYHFIWILIHVLFIMVVIIHKP